MTLLASLIHLAGEETVLATSRALDLRRVIQRLTIPVTAAAQHECVIIICISEVFMEEGHPVVSTGKSATTLDGPNEPISRRQ